MSATPLFVNFLNGQPIDVSTALAGQLGLTQGSVLFAGAGGAISQNNANLFWDNTHNRLGIGQTSPGYPLDIQSAGPDQARFQSTGANRAEIIIDNAAGGNQSIVAYLDAGVIKWQVGKQTDNSWLMYDDANAKSFLTVSTAGVVGIGESGQRVNVTGSSIDTALITQNGLNGLAITPQGSAVNYLQIQPSNAGGGPAFNAIGTDTDINIFIASKGNGALVFQTAGSSKLILTSTAVEIVQTPTAISATGGLASTSVSIGNAADSSTNLGHRFSINLNGTTYWVPCGSVAF